MLHGSDEDPVPVYGYLFSPIFRSFTSVCFMYICMYYSPPLYLILLFFVPVLCPTYRSTIKYLPSIPPTQSIVTDSFFNGVFNNRIFYV